MELYEEVLGFWLGPLDASGRASKEQAARWFTRDPAFDQEIRERFGALYEEILRGEHQGWLGTPRGRVAYVIVLDQLSRNMFRGSGRMYDGDARALEVAREGVEGGDDRQLAYAERSFLYMPFMHAEDLEAQERCVELFRALEGAASAEKGSATDYAVQHLDIVRRFGRFPHRNALLGRESTPEELAFLEQPGSSF